MNYEKFSVRTKWFKGLHSQRFSFISGDSGHRDKHFATIFMKIDPAVFDIWSFLNLIVAEYGGRHFVLLVT